MGYTLMKGAYAHATCLPDHPERCRPDDPGAMVPRAEHPGPTGRRGPGSCWPPPRARRTRTSPRSLSISRGTVARWRDRFAESGHRRASRRTRRAAGGRRRLATTSSGEIIEMTTQQKPANATHWSTRTLAEALGTNRSLVNRVWRANGLEAAPVPDLQGEQRPPLRREAGRRRRPLPRPAGARPGALRRREEPDPGAGPHPEEPADLSRPVRDDDPRLQAERHDHAVRRARRGWRGV